MNAREGWTCTKCKKLSPRTVRIVNQSSAEEMVLCEACCAAILSVMKRSHALHSQAPRSKRRPRA